MIDRLRGSNLTQRRIRRRVTLTGVLQGIGCRPTIFRLARKTGVAGWVVNTSSGVRMEVEGTPEQYALFMEEVRRGIPFPGRIDSETVEELPPRGDVSFRIETSEEGVRLLAPIPPDVAMCPECLREMLDPTNRRYLYPFTTCTLCGPRFTVVRSFPYDRERTSMADFTMCPECRAEYETPEDRRFHSQTNSCQRCGPRLYLTDERGEPLDGDPVVRAAGMLKDGGILAIKGIGGFHLACDALNEQAVALLRKRKGRAEKPFAVMAPDIGVVRRFCEVGKVEEELLASPVAPIVLLAARPNGPAPGVAPFVGTLGIMLPYSPLHHLLFHHPGIRREDKLTLLVMTSGNLSEEPIARGNDEAFERLRHLVDGFLIHNREIVLSADDSIFRVIAKRPVVFRRSRGIVPSAFTIPYFDAPEGGYAPGTTGENTGPTILGAGGDLKNAQAILKGPHVVPGPHVGDLASPVAQDYFKQSAKVLSAYLDVSPRVVAVDPHPEYFSNSLAHGLDAVVEEIFHHHAHAVSLLFEHGIRGPILFAVFDGTGFGTDGSIWGGEFLLADIERFERLGNIGRFPLPGGEAAIRQPVRILAALLRQGADEEFPDRFKSLLGDHVDRVPLWLEAVAKGINSPETTSAGRLFDAAAAAAGFLRSVSFEGQAAMWLEGIAEAQERGTYPVRFVSDTPTVADPASLVTAMALDALSSTPPRILAARFHNSMAELIVEALKILRGRTGINIAGLSGGCFQNRFLTERTYDLLKDQGFRVLLHESVPPNDGGIAIGQALSAWARLRGGRSNAERSSV